MKEKIIIVGKGGSGKDYLRDKFVARGYSRTVSYTTRPKRINEVDDIDYHFISEEDFAFYHSKGYFYEIDCFNGWHYGTSIIQWNTKQVLIMTPRGVAKISEEDRKKCFIIYLDIEEFIRRKRLLKRQDADNVERRLEADRKDFANFKDYDIKITSSKF